MGGWKGSVENRSVLDEDEDKENLPPSTPVSVTPTEPPTLQRNRAFGTIIENVHHFIQRNLFL